MVENEVQSLALFMITLLDGEIIHASTSHVGGFDLPNTKAAHWQDRFSSSAHDDINFALMRIQQDKAEHILLLADAKHALHAVHLHPLLDEQANTIAVAWYSESTLDGNKPYYEMFHQSTIAQWIIDPRPLFYYLEYLAVSCIADLEQKIAAGELSMGTIRGFFTILDANAAALELYNMESIDRFKINIPVRAKDQSIVDVCNAVLNIGKVRKHQAYQTDIDVSGEHKKTLFVSCEIPAIANMSEGMFISMLDITALKMAENEAQDREQFLSAILRAIPDIVMVYDFSQRKPIFQNFDLAELLGYDEQEVIDTRGRFLNYIAHPEDSIDGNALKNMYSHLAAGDVYEHNLRLQHNNGEWHHFFFRSAALDKDERGNVINAVVVARDITEALKTRQIFNAQQRRYQLLADNFSDVILTLDTEGKVNYVSSSVKNLIGISAEEFLCANDCLSLLGLGAQLPVWKQVLADSVWRVDSNARDFAEWIQTKIVIGSKKSLPVEVQVTLLRDEHQLLEGLLVIVRDIGERIKNESDRQLAAKVFENSAEAIYITNAVGDIVQANDAFVAISGYAIEQVLGRKPAELGSGWNDINFIKDIKPALDKGGRWSGELMSRRASGEAFMVSMTISYVHDIEDHVSGMITSFRDITEAKTTEEGIKKLAYFDYLTDLPNRMLFNDRLAQAVQRASRNRHYLAVLFLDLDGFKAVNDEFGHAMGDRLLFQAGVRLKECVRGDDTVARLGGDEFAVVLNGLANKELAETAAALIASKIVFSLNKPFVLDGVTVGIGVSVGIAVYPDDAHSIEELIKKADTAMYHAKSLGKNNFKFFAGHMQERALQIQKNELDFRDALHKNQLRLALQPKLRAKDQHIYGFEALLRWQHPQKGLLMPVSFLRVLDDLSLSVSVGEWVVQHACEQLKEWRVSGRGEWTLSVNIFAQHYRSPGFVSFIRNMLDQYQICPELLTLEFSESIVMADIGFAYGVFSELQLLGVCIAIDDFGTGLLSLMSLNRLPINEIKIDRQCTHQIDSDKKQLRLVHSIMAIANTFGFSVVAEGIEYQAQLDALLQIGCPNVQGFLFYRPMFSVEIDEKCGRI